MLPRRVQKGYDKTDYAQLFPDIYKIETGITKYPTFGDYIRKSYRGGWCYLVSGKENKIYHYGTTADVNSLYPSMMHSDSGNFYPVGKPHYWSGNFIHEEALKKTHRVTQDIFLTYSYKVSCERWLLAIHSDKRVSALSWYRNARNK